MRFFGSESVRGSAGHRFWWPAITNAKYNVTNSQATTIDRLRYRKLRHHGVFLIAALSLPVAFSQARIEGTVVNSLTSAPVRKVEISIDAREGDKHYSADTTADGKFVIENIDPGDYRITAKRFGYLEKKGDDLKLDAKSDIKEIVVKFAPAGVIAGRVVDDDGDPVANEGVEIEQRFHLNNESGDADAEGHFLFAGLRPGRYTLSVSERYSRVDARDTVYVLAAPPAPLDIKPGTEFRNIEIRLHRVAVHRVRGKLSEIPAESVSMTMNSSDSGEISRAAQTKADGSFEFGSIPAGAYVIRVRTFEQELDRATGNSMLRRAPFYFNFPIVVGDKDVDGLIVPVGPPASLNVKFILLGPSPGIPPSLTLETGFTKLTPSEALADGTLRFPKLAWDDYQINFHNLPDNSYTKSMRLNQEDIARVLDLRSGGDSTLEIVIAPNAAEITGALRDGAVAHLWRDIPLDSRLPEKGEVKFDRLAPGEYHLLAWEFGTDFDPDDPETRKEFASYITTVTVAEREHARVELKVIPNP